MTTLVTGASGFLGSGLIHEWLSSRDANVRALARNPKRLQRLAGLDLDLRLGSIENDKIIDEAVNGCNIVYHCAHDFQVPEVNVRAAHLLGVACLRHRVRRLVYVSSMCVYEPFPDGDLTEESPAKLCGSVYADNKLIVEEILLHYAAEHGLPVVILQPTIVYGAYSPWTVNTVEVLRERRLVLPSDRPGLCNLVYVDDVVTVLLLAGTTPDIEKQRFLVSGPAPVTWVNYFREYEQILGIKSVTLMPSREIECAGSSQPDPNNSELPLLFPDAARLALYSAVTTVKIDKARKMLGYEPAFDFARGMALTAQHLIPPVAVA